MKNEKRLIDANTLAEKVWNISMYIFGVRNGKTLIKEFLEKYRDSVMKEIANAPIVDAVEVVHGRWIKQNVNCGWWAVCSECGNTPISTRAMTKYCPECGAKMDGDGVEN